jgi:O-antigen/teichoic acid export membrane protein
MTQGERVGESTEAVPGGRTARIVRNTLVRGGAQGVSVVASFVMLPFLVRAFTLGDYGVFMLASAVTSYAALLDLGVGSTLVRMVAERLARGERDQVGAVVASAGVFYAVVGLVAALAMVAIGSLGRSIFAVQPAQAQLLTRLLLIGAAVQLLYWPASAAAHALSGFERYDLISAIAMTQTIGGVLAVAAVLLLGLGPVDLALINAGITVVTSLANIVLFAGVARSRIGPLRPRSSLVTRVVRDGLPLFALQMSALLGRQTTDRIVLGVFLGPEAVGVYEIAAKLSLLVSQAGDLLTGAILPIAANMSAREHAESLRALLMRGARYTVVAIAPVIVVLACIARPFISDWFGPGMAGAASVAQVLLLGQVLVPLYLVGDPILIGMNRFARWVVPAFSVAVLNVALSVVFVKMFGLVGVAVGTAIAGFVEFPLYVRLAVRETGVDWRAWLWQAFFPGYPLLVVPACIALLGAATFLGQSLLSLFAVSVVALGAYWALAWWLVLPRWERAELVAAVGTMARRPGGTDSPGA